MRNALIPVVTLVALQIPTIFTGAVITEQIFRVPGIGSLLISSILANDTPVIMAITFVFSCLVVIFNLVADLLYGWLDPAHLVPLRPTAPRTASRPRRSGGGRSRAARRRPTRSGARRWRRFRKHRLAMVGGWSCSWSW